MSEKQEAVFCNTINWEKVEDKIWEKILWKDEKSGTYVRLIRVDAGFKGEKALSHEFDELVYVLQGHQVHSKEGTEWHQGTFSFFPAGTEHGPFKTDEGILSIEFRYYHDKQD
jgi:quercetin dioxygenase-like cupin family protein